MKLSISSIVIGGIILFMLGVYASIMLSMSESFDIDPTISFEINPLELFTLIATIALGIYVAKTIARQNDISNTKKKIIIDNLSSYQDNIGLIINGILSSELIEFESVTKKLKILRIKMSSILNIVTEQTEVDSNDSDIVELNIYIRDLWELMTDSSSEEVTVEDNKINYSARIEVAIESKVIAINQKLINLAMKIK